MADPCTLIENYAAPASLSRYMPQRLSCDQRLRVAATWSSVKHINSTTKDPCLVLSTVSSQYLTPIQVVSPPPGFWTFQLITICLPHLSKPRQFTIAFGRFQFSLEPSLWPCLVMFFSLNDEILERPCLGVLCLFSVISFYYLS